MIICRKSVPNDDFVNANIICILHIRGGCLGKNYKINFITIARAYTYDTELIPIFIFDVLAVLTSNFHNRYSSIYNITSFCSGSSKGETNYGNPTVQ